MENASKALIIAGAILLAISIIGIGMFIFQQAQSAMSDTGLDQEKIAAYNEDFLRYEGVQSGTQVRALCDIIRNHNAHYSDDPSRNVNVHKDGTLGSAAPSAAVPSTTVNGVKTTIRQGAKYNVNFGYDDSTGFIVDVQITDAT